MERAVIDLDGFSIERSLSPTEVHVPGLAGATADDLRGLIMMIVSGTGRRQVRYVAGFDESAHVVTVGAPWAVVPDSTSQCVFRKTPSWDDDDDVVLYDGATWEVIDPDGEIVATSDNPFNVSFTTGKVGTYTLRRQ